VLSGALPSLICTEQKEAVRGATYDLLDDRGPDAFGSLPGDAYAALSDRDRQRLQQRVLA
jgi:hypothetical protein